MVGVGNVAIDVARILSRTPEELEKTDIADHALEALRASRVREVYLLGRRGAAQAAFTNPEIKELGELADADVVVKPEEVALDELSRESLDKSGDRAGLKKVEILQAYAQRPAGTRPRRLVIRFLVSPVALLDNGGAVGGIRLVRNRLVASETGTIQAKATDQFEELSAGLVFRSVGYRGVALPGVPFDEKWGVVLNEKVACSTGHRRGAPREYTAGWIKRGATGVIGTNKPDAAETVQAMTEDLAAGHTLAPAEPDAATLERLIQQRQPQVVSYADWLRLNEIEVERGRARGRPRVKFTRVDDMLAALGNRGPR